jgi:lipopolysaccharide export system protein LptA
MLRPFFIISIVLLLFTGSVAFSEEPPTKVQGPITVTSETLTTDNKAHTALFERNVVAKTPEMTIYADSMLVFYTEDSGDITTIESTGNVKLYKDTRLITADKAVYHADKAKVVFTGNPRAMDGDNVVTGSTMTYFIDDDRSVVENSKVYLKNREN